ncbi:MAG: hypothetical protein ACOCUY_00540 [Verrucomicrobiota bacterium]
MNVSDCNGRFARSMAFSVACTAGGGAANRGYLVYGKAADAVDLAREYFDLDDYKRSGQV